MKIAEIISTQQTPQKLSTGGGLQHPSEDIDRLNLEAPKGDTVDLRSDNTGTIFRKANAITTTQRNDVANSIRIADEAMQNIGTNIREMKTTLNRIVKQYPPFPPGSEERVALLKRFATMRKEIEALAIPPEDAGARRILSPAKDEGEPDAVVYIGGDRFRIYVHRLPVGTGPEGLDIPDLPVDTADDQIQDMLLRLEVAGKTLASKQDRLAADAEKII